MEPPVEQNPPLNPPVQLAGGDGLSAAAIAGGFEARYYSTPFHLAPDPIKTRPSPPPFPQQPAESHNTSYSYYLRPDPYLVRIDGKLCAWLDHIGKSDNATAAASSSSSSSAPCLPTTTPVATSQPAVHYRCHPSAMQGPPYFSAPAIAASQGHHPDPVAPLDATPLRRPRGRPRGRTASARAITAVSPSMTSPHAAAASHNQTAFVPQWQVSGEMQPDCAEAWRAKKRKRDAEEEKYMSPDALVQQPFLAQPVVHYKYSPATQELPYFTAPATAPQVYHPAPVDVKPPRSRVRPRGSPSSARAITTASPPVPLPMHPPVGALTPAPPHATSVSQHETASVPLRPVSSGRLQDCAESSWHAEKRERDVDSDKVDAGSGGEEEEEYRSPNVTGVRFAPTPEELVWYLDRKFKGRDLPIDFIKDFDVYRKHPDTLSDSCGPSVDGFWYVFSPRVRKYVKGGRPARSAEDVDFFWKSNTKESSFSIESDYGEVVCNVNSLSHEDGHQPKGKKSGWKMTEHRIPAMQIDKNSSNDSNSMLLDPWVICKIHFKDPAKKGEAKSEEDSEEEGSDEQEEGGGDETDGNGNSLEPWSFEH